MRNWDEYIEEQKHWLSGAGYNQEIELINQERKRLGQSMLEPIPVNKNERYFIVSNERMCFVIKLSAFNKMNQTQRNKLYAIGNGL